MTAVCPAVSPGAGPSPPEPAITAKPSPPEPCRVPARPPAEERPLAELGARDVPLAVLGDIRRAGAGRVQPCDDRTIRAPHLAVHRNRETPEGEPGVQRVPGPQVEHRPRTLVLRRQPL